MEIFLTKQCESFTGSLGKGFGYHIQRRTDRNGKKRFWGVRQSNGEIPADGHLRFIFICAELAQLKVHITDIRVPRKELSDALWEAGYKPDSNNILGDDDLPELLSATDIIKIRRDYLPGIVFNPSSTYLYL